MKLEQSLLRSAISAKADTPFSRRMAWREVSSVKASSGVVSIEEPVRRETGFLLPVCLMRMWEALTDMAMEDLKDVETGEIEGGGREERG